MRRKWGNNKIITNFKNLYFFKKIISLTLELLQKYYDKFISVVACQRQGWNYFDFFHQNIILESKLFQNKFFLSCFTQNYWKNELVSEPVTDLDSSKR